MHRSEASLLPVGLYDQLPPVAETETRALGALLNCFGDFGYAQVGAPLLEFEETLLSGKGADLGPHSFRIMDPISRRMLALRADMTMQIARIATDRLKDTPRPLRLCYAGQTLRVKSESLHARRQFRQVGIELIADGALATGADAETIGVSLSALAQVGLNNVSLDLNAPGLVRGLLAPLSLPDDARRELELSIARKDETALEAAVLPPMLTELLRALMKAAGSACHAVPALRAVELKGNAAKQRDALCLLVDTLRAQWPNLAISLDAVEARGFEYHHGISFCFFAPNAQTELGRGGRYMLDGTSEATGVTLYLDALHPLLTPHAARRKILICGTAPQDTLQNLHKEGYQTLLAAPEIHTEDDACARARAEGAAFVWLGGKIIALHNEG